MNDTQYKILADEYLRQYGAQLRGELDSIERDGPTYITPLLDRRVRRGIAALKRPRYIKYAGLVAACLAIALLAPFVLRLNQGRVGEQSPGIYAPPVSQDGTSRPGAETAVPSDKRPGASTDSPARPGTPASPDAPAGPGTPASPDSPARPGTPASPDSPAPPSSEVYEALPLSFQIPARFTVASVDQDVGITIYHLRDDNLDDVVITLERSGDISKYNDLLEIPVGAGHAFASGGSGYNLLAIMDEGSDILYTLTCRHDVNTLVLLGGSII